MIVFSISFFKGKIFDIFLVKFHNEKYENKNIVARQSQILLALILLLFSLITIPTIILSLYLKTTPNNITSIITPTSSTSCFKPSVKLIDEGKYIKLEIKDNYSITRTLYSQHLMIVDPSVFLKFNGNEFTYKLYYELVTNLVN